MADEERTYSIGTYYREFESIQKDLGRLSENLDNCLSDPSTTNLARDYQGTKAGGAQNLHLLVTCSIAEFDDKIKTMGTVDIDMAIFYFEEQIQLVYKLDEDAKIGDSNLSQLRQKLIKCFLRKAELSKHHTRTVSVGLLKEKDGDHVDRTEDIAAYEDIGSLSFAELQALLYYNGVQYDGNASKDVLVSLVKREVLDIMDESDEEWEPPGDHEINWTMPRLNSETKTVDHEPCQFDEVRSDEGSENKDELVVSPEEASNRNEESQAEEYQGKQAETILEKNESKRASDLGGTQPETREEKEKTLVEKTYQETLSNTEEDSPVMALADQPQDCSPQINDQILLNQKEDESVVDWDPTPLLEDLLADIRRPEAISFEKKETQEKSNERGNSKLEGYLEKLPVNQSKPTLLKGWKKRYFRISLGKIHYFQDHLAAKPLGSILLTGSDLKVVNEREIQVVAQNTGNLLTIKCSSSNESNDWYRMIKRESAISTPVTAPVKVPSQLENPMRSDFIIIDLGANTIKGGFVGEEQPRVVFPAVYAVKKELNGKRKFTESGLPDPSMCRCGYDALKPEVRKNSKLIFPLRPTLKVDKFSIKTRYIPGFIDKVVKDLGVDPQNSTVILICQRHFGDKDKESILDHLFGHLGVSAVHSAQQALLSLYSYKDTTGIVVDIGDHIDVFPVIEDCIIENASSSIPQGGQLVTENLARLLSEGGYRFFSEIESYIVRYLKEKTAFVSIDYEKELEVKANDADVVVDVGKYNLPGKQKSINISSERFRCAEGLFDPNKWGKDYDGIHKMVEKAIKQSGIDHRKELCKKIFLSGGTTMIEGFRERLQKEVKLLMPETVNVTVHAAENRANAAFMGATVIAEQPTFSRNLVDKESWFDHGIDIFNRMTVG